MGHDWGTIPQQVSAASLLAIFATLVGVVLRYRLSTHRLDNEEDADKRDHIADERVMARSQQITGYFVADDEIDSAVDMLKDDLDACAREMKRVAALERRGSLFEGWVSGVQ